MVIRPKFNMYATNAFVGYEKIVLGATPIWWIP
jgi:hypothetical protein